MGKACRTRAYLGSEKKVEEQDWPGGGLHVDRQLRRQQQQLVQPLGSWLCSQAAQRRPCKPCHQWHDFANFSFHQA